MNTFASINSELSLCVLLAKQNGSDAIPSGMVCFHVCPNIEKSVRKHPENLEVSQILVNTHTHTHTHTHILTARN